MHTSFDTSPNCISIEIQSKTHTIRIPYTKYKKIIKKTGLRVQEEGSVMYINLYAISKKCYEKPVSLFYYKM